ncbi:MAG: hypothetical protein RJA55_2654, partial [Acidobacteriota bacterium]
AELERSDFRSDELDVEGLLTFAEHVLENLSPLWINAGIADRRILPRASDLWVQASLDHKQRLQQLFFPEGVAYDGKRFNRTAVTIPAFSWLRAVSEEESCVASPTGFEPVF